VCLAYIQGKRIAALLAKEVKADLKRETTKKDKGRQRDGPPQPAHFKTKAQKKRANIAPLQQEQNTNWPAGFPPEPALEQHTHQQTTQYWPPQQINDTWAQAAHYMQTMLTAPQQPTRHYHLPQTPHREYCQTPYEDQEHYSGRGRGQSEKGRGRGARCQGRG
jgi:hypothetical protein